MIPRKYIVAIVLLYALGFVIYAPREGSPLLLAAAILLPFIFIFSFRADWIGRSAITLYLSLLTLPAMPLDLMLYQVLMLVFVVSAVFQRMVGEREANTPPGRTWTIFFLFWMLALIYVRGIGVRILGAGQVGGAPYIHIIISIGFYLFSGCLAFSPKQWKITLGCMAILTIYPVFVHLAIVLSGGQFLWPLFFTKTTYALRMTFMESESDSGMIRWAIFGHLRYLFLFPAILLAFRPGNRKYFLFFFVICLLGSMMSGTRLWILHTLVFISIFTVVSSHHRGPTIVLLGLTAIVGIGIAVLFSDQLPYAIQRVISQLPGAHVDVAALADAEGTLQWRRLLWTLAWEKLPQYLFFGKGFAFDSTYLMHGFRIFTPSDQVLREILTGDLHLGPFAILYIFGIPGFILVATVTWANASWHIKRQFASWHNPDLKRFHKVFLVFLASNCALYLISGSAQIILPELFFQFAVLHGLAVSDEKWQTDIEQEAHP